MQTSLFPWSERSVFRLFLVCGNIFADHDIETQRVSRVTSVPFCWSSFYRRDQICLSLVHPRLIANITRCFFWLGNRFEFALLLQSILMILAQVIVLSKVYTQTRNQFIIPAARPPIHLHTLLAAD
jgi:hypothetical protein